MARHIRLALFDVEKGTAEEALAIARDTIRPLVQQRAGLQRYDVGILDDGGIVSLTIWETAEQALEAVKFIDGWVHEHMEDRLELREEHVGDLAWDETP